LIIKEHKLVLGETVLSEFERILLKKFKLPQNEVSEILDFLRSFEVCPYSEERSPIELSDKDDEKVLANAIKSNSEILVTGDKDLLEIKENLKIRILSPRDFLVLTKSK
jgi:putative PIN family toxin of toxin-antitoxin system